MTDRLFPNIIVHSYNKIRILQNLMETVVESRTLIKEIFYLCALLGLTS